MNILLIVIFYIYLTCYEVFRFKQADEKSKFKFILINLFYFYLLFLISVTVLKHGDFTLYLSDSLQKANFTPIVPLISLFDSSLPAKFGLINIIGNIIITLPLGFFVSLFFPSKSKLHSLIVYGLLTSLLIEVLQLFVRVCVFDVNDILLNTLGVIIGGGFYCLFQQIFNRLKQVNFLKSVQLNSEGSLIKLSAVPVSVMITLFMAAVPISFLKNTYPATMLPEDQAVGNFDTKILSISSDEFSLSLEHSSKKLTFKAYHQTLFNRVRLINNKTLDLSQVKTGAQMVDFYDKYTDSDRFGIAVFGYTEEVIKAEIIFQGNKYTEQIEEGPFLVLYPELLRDSAELDLFQVYNNNSAHLQINFIDQDGNHLDLLRLH